MRKRAVHFYSPGVVRRSHTAARPLLVRSAAVAHAAAAGVVVYKQFDDCKLICITVLGVNFKIRHQARREGGKGKKFSRAPRRFGGPADAQKY